MQQQEILFRKATFKLLSRAESLRQTWNTYQTATLTILSTLGNLQQQQSMTSNEETTRQLKDKYALDPQRLLYSQTMRFEKAMRQLRTRLDQWQEVIQDWQQLAIDAQHNAAKAEALHLTNNTGSSSTKGPSIPPLSSHSLLQVAVVSPAQAHQWISQLEHLYKRQYHCKRMLFLSATNGTDLARIIDQWSSDDLLQSHPTTQDISDRVQLYNHVKKAIESV